MENAEEKIFDLISSEPGYRLVFYKLLKLCETARPATKVVDSIRSLPEMQTAIHSPHIVLGWLEEAGGVERIAASVEAAEQEEETEEKWRTTEAGKRVAEKEAPQKRLLELLAREPIYSQIYVQVLGFCQSPRKRTEIEELLKDNPIMEKPQVYPTFFLQGLEEAGGLEWVDSHWRTTEAGKGVLG